jgi:hypothetical protein
LDYIKSDPDTMMLLASVHLKTTGNPESVVDLDGILNTAEKYAATGVRLLREAQKNSPDLRLWLQTQVHAAYGLISDE